MFLRHFGLMVLFLVWVPTGVSAQEVRACYTGPPDTIGVGPCRTGTQTRTAYGWSACEGEVFPITDIADNGIDEDCDGLDQLSICREGECRDDESLEPLLLFSLVFLVGSGCYYYWLRRRAVRKEEK